MKRITKRTKVNKHWCSIYLSPIATDIYNLGLIINKSMRASNDWYSTRKNKRRRKAINDKSIRTLKHLRVCYRLLQQVLIELPSNIHILIENDSIKAQSLSRFVERLGFIQIPKDGRLFWVLTAQKRMEVQHCYERTKTKASKINGREFDIACG